MIERSARRLEAADDAIAASVDGFQHRHNPGKARRHPSATESTTMTREKLPIAIQTFQKLREDDYSVLKQ